MNDKHDPDWDEEWDDDLGLKHEDGDWMSNINDPLSPLNPSNPSSPLYDSNEF